MLLTWAVCWGPAQGCLWVGVGAHTCLTTFLAACLWDSGAVMGVRIWIGRKGRPRWLDPGGTAALWIRPSVSMRAVPHPMWAGDMWVEERFCLEGGQLGTF